MSCVRDGADGESLPDVRGLEDSLGYAFDDPSILARALTHTSFRAEQPDVEADNQRLEYLGDAVVGFVVADALFRRYPEVDEGQLSKWRSRLVRRSALVEVAGRIGLSGHLRLGEAEERTGGRRRESVLADAYEAVLAAVYLDGGFERAREVVTDLHAEEIERAAEGGAVDHKSRLQEISQAKYGRKPDYRIADDRGPAHDKTFVAEVAVSGEIRGRGVGGSKKEAEQAAAGEALEEIEA